MLRHEHHSNATLADLLQKLVAPDAVPWLFSDLHRSNRFIAIAPIASGGINGEGSGLEEIIFLVMPKQILNFSSQ